MIHRTGFYAYILDHHVTVCPGALRAGVFFFWSEKKMNGSQLTVYASQSHRVGGAAVVDWLLEQIKQSGIHGATVIEASEGIDAHGKYHAARFFELADQPVAVTAVADDGHIEALLASLRGASVRLFYTRFPIEYGELGED